MTQSSQTGHHSAHRRWPPRITLVLVIIVAVLAGGLANRHSFESDWTAASRHTLTAGSIEILNQLDQPLIVIAFTRDQQLAKTMADRIARYQRHSNLISFETVNPDQHPNRAEAAGIDQDGVLFLTLGERHESLRQLDEQSISNAILRLSRGAGIEILVLTGHGERSAKGQANRDISHFANTLLDQGFQISLYQIDPTAAIPTANTLLVISAPQTRLSGGEIARLLAFIQDGGRLLWLGDPGDLQGLKPLAIQLGVRFLPGTLVDPAGMQAAGSAAFTLATADAYRPHPITQQFQFTTVFPLATGLSQNDNRWQATPLAIVGEQGWLEQGELVEPVEFDKQHDLLGPVTLALALTREQQKNRENNSENNPGDQQKPQRVVIVGDGDFVANAYLGNGGNRQLGLNIINWLAGDDQLINLQPIVAADTRLDLSPTHALIVGLGFLLVLPALLALTGGIIWWRRC
ncbi:MAG: hypothetical protein DRQ60_00115 [Gammaproteobacteria bacterium]|nr:MAG: hypothetical protein DRQ54_00315 [Gammaproteobacteria bacterium]RLA16099.1 MAG: hypothetical protein DRQ52_00315 [Gammaproteobacteria bacterium]RLA18214.1 MAG: hypothetical protein DRQ60_00115 [Gammaproteobacteria bacterium]